MKPYYEHGGIAIYHQDCRVRVPTPDGVSVIIADPPYGDTSLDWDSKVDGWADAMQFYCSNMWVFGSFRYFFENAPQFACWTLAQDLIWEKHNGSSFHSDRFKRVHENVAQFYRGDWASVYKSPVTTSDATARTVRRKQRPPHTGHIEAGSYASWHYRSPDSIFLRPRWGCARSILRFRLHVGGS